MLKGYIDEVFVSVQGEGILAGTPMLFVRFGGCGVGCAHCDTPRAQAQLSRFKIHGYMEKAVDNPVSAAALAEDVIPLLRTVPYVALTGGEPLEQPGFLLLLLERLGRAGKKVLLDSGGRHYQELEEVISYVDVVGADLKLPSFSGGPWQPETSRRFIEIAQTRVCYVKVVVGDDTPASEVETAVQLVASINRRLPFVIQPRWDGKPPTPQHCQFLIRTAIAAAAFLDDVRVIPQLHRVLGVK